MVLLQVGVFKKFIDTIIDELGKKTYLIWQEGGPGRENKTRHQIFVPSN